MKKLLFLLMTLLPIICCGNKGKVTEAPKARASVDTPLFLDQAIPAINNGDKAKAKQLLDEFSARLEKLDEQGGIDFLQAYWEYRENYGRIRPGSKMEFDSAILRMLLASDGASAGVFLFALTDASLAAQNDDAYSNVVLMSMKYKNFTTPARLQAMNKKGEEWYRSRGEALLPEVRATSLDEMPPADYAVEILEWLYLASENRDTDLFMGYDGQIGLTDWLSPEQWDEYHAAKDAWKQANPDRWEAIRAYRQDLIEEGNTLHFEM